MRFRARLPFAASALAAGACLLPAAATAAVPQIEQINRASGASGAFSLIAGPSSGIPHAITDDGRFASWAMVNDSFEPAYDAAYATPGYGLFVRDIVQNTTAKVASAKSSFTALDRTGRLFSFVTKDRLDPADDNDLLDLYVYERTTGLKVLVSRQGLLGPALGVTSSGAVLEGSRYAVFGSATGVLRRDLLTGRNTRISGGFYGDEFVEDPWAFGVDAQPADQFASADGKVVATSEGIFTPSATYPLETNDFGAPARPFIAAPGDVAVYQLEGGSAASVRVRNLTTGAVTTPAVPAELATRFGVNLFRLSADGKSGIVASFSFSGGFSTHLDRWNFAAGTLTPVGVPFGTQPSENGRFYINGSGTSSNMVLSAHAAPGSTLPGSIQVPSPNAYLGLVDECTYGDPARLYRVTANSSESLPRATSVRVKATRPDGTVLLDQTLTVPVGPEDPYEMAEIPVGSDAFRIDATVTLADGRTATERTTRPALPVGQSCLGPLGG